MSAERAMCSFCYDFPTVVWRAKCSTERLLLLVTAIILNLSVVEMVVQLMSDENASYCPSHFFDGAKIMQEIVDLKANGWMAPIGVRILELMANSVLVDFIEARSLEKSIRIYLRNFSEDVKLQYGSTGTISRLPYVSYTLGKPAVYRCVQCGDEKSYENTQFLTRRHDKAAFGVFAGCCLSGMMNCEQAHAAAMLPSLPLCPTHLESQVRSMKSLCFKLHEPEADREFTETMMRTFCKGWMDPLKSIFCFINKFDQEAPPEAAQCKFCKLIDKSVVVDDLLDTKAHIGCFKARTNDILWELREVKVEKGGSIEIRVPCPEALEHRRLEHLESMLAAMRRHFHDRVWSKAQERVNCIVLFAKYWSRDTKLDEKIAMEKERIRAEHSKTFC